MVILRNTASTSIRLLWATTELQKMNVHTVVKYFRVDITILQTSKFSAMLNHPISIITGRMLTFRSLNPYAPSYIHAPPTILLDSYIHTLYTHFDDWDPFL
jgi:hypothetical protein